MPHAAGPVLDPVPLRGTLRIGRAPDNDVVLDDPNVSRHHAELIGGATPRLRDLGSRIGTRVDDALVSDAPFPPGSAAGIGPFALRHDGERVIVSDTRDRLTLRARDVGVAIGERTILHPTSLAVGTGELVGVIGPSGSGKSTLLRALAGVSEPTEGAVTLGADHVALRSTDVGYLPEGDTVHDRLTVREALGYAAALRLPRDTGRAEMDERVDAVLQELRLADRADTWIRDLSGGERKRAACAVELIGDPTMLLLDEPGTGLDPMLERRLMVLLRGLADKGRGVLVVTHATSSLALCDRVAVIGPGGHLRHVGTPRDVLEHFGVHAYDEIYDALDVAGAPGRAPAPDAPRRGPAGRRRGPAPVAGPFASQAVTLAERYARCLVRDRRTLLVLLAQAPIIGLCVGLVLPYDVLGERAFAPFYGVLLTFLLLTGCNWLGVIAACREIVKERSIVEREAAIGVRPDAYLAAKAMVLFPLVITQVALLMLVTVMRQPLHVSPGTYLVVGGLCVLAACAAAAMGLAVSAFARSADQASSAVPLLFVPQLLFAGAIIPTALMSPPVQALANLTYSRWTLGGLGGAMGIGERLSDEASSVAGYDRDFFSLDPGAAAVAMLFFIMLMALLAARGLSRRSTS
jgi:ABC-type multidrug transport system ATPase subunit